jgi:putative ABC transport system permease protein
VSRRTVKPPRFAEWMLALLYSDRGEFTHLGDFREAFEDVAARRGRTAALAWYAFQVIRSLPGLVVAKVYWALVMFRSSCVISFRNLGRDKGASLVNLGGLAVGLACFLLILAYGRFETSYDRFHEKAGRIFRVLEKSEGMGELNTSTPDVLAAALTTNIPGVARATIIYPASDEVLLEYHGKRFAQKGFYADEAFLEIFSFPALRGNAQTALAGPSAIALTESAATKLFCDEDPIGKVVGRETLGGHRDLTVKAVLRDVPANSHLRFDYLVSMETLRSSPSGGQMFGDWDVCYFTTYVELAPGWSRESVENLVPAMMSTAAGDKDRSSMKFALQPLTDIHLKSKSVSGNAADGDIRYVRLFLTIAVLILLIAVVNHVNLSTAQAGLRAREISIRKAVGAHRGQLFSQFLGESLFVTALASALALVLIIALVPRFDRLFGVAVELPLPGLGGLWPWLAATVILAGFLAGAYPALLLSGFQPVSTLREYVPSGRKGSVLRNLLVVFQFASSVVLVMATAVVLDQMNFVKSERLGYDRAHVVIIPARDKETLDKLPMLAAGLEERPEVVKASLSAALPTRLAVRYYGLQMTRDDGTKVKLDFQSGSVDENFLQVYGIELAAGRNFRAGDRNVILLNQTAVRELGWKNPLGRHLRNGPLEVVGVVKDFHYGSLRDRIGPMSLTYAPGGISLAVRVRPGDVGRTVGILRSVFENTLPGRAFDFYFLDDAYNALYRKEVRTGRIFGAFAGLAVLVACLGLLGLTSFNVARRQREIGIRKVMGAPLARLVLMLNGDFMRLILLANLVAWPIAYYAMSRWLENFAYRVPVRPRVFVAAGLLSLTAAVLVAGWLTVRAALRNPVDVLRHE